LTARAPEPEHARVRAPVTALFAALTLISCKPKAPPARVTFANVCSTAFDAVRGLAPDVTIEGYLTLPTVGTACGSTCLLMIAAKPGDTAHVLNAFLKVGGGPNTMDPLAATYQLGDLKVHDSTGKLLDLHKKVRLTGWRAGQGGLGCGINPYLIEAAE
jgi:hypothetical protein